MVSEATLLEGSWYALEQAGRLLHAAVGVYDRCDPGTALALAMFGREEVGRSRILRTLAHEVATGATFNTVEVTKRCENHVRKQREGATGTTLSIVPPSELAKAAQSRVSSAHGSPEWKAARDVISAAAASKAKRDPQDRHDMREKALYVDLDSNSKCWSRPCAIDATVAREHIEDAVGDYASECDALRDDVIAADFPAMAKARAGMRPAPVLLEAIWPSIEQTG
ncbi:MAG: AbiV family abortive infection protein [Nitrospirota bacterium]